MTNGMISQIWHWASLHSIMHGLWKPGTSVTPVYDRMDSRFRGNDEKRNVAHWVPLVGKRMEARMDSRLHGNDGKRPPLSPPPEGGRYEGGEPGVTPAPSVIPAKAGIYLHMARWVSGIQTDGLALVSGVGVCLYPVCVPPHVWLVGWAGRVCYGSTTISIHAGRLSAP